MICLALAAPLSGHAATYYGRVQYARGGRPVADVRVEARSLSRPNLLFFVPQMPYLVVAHTNTRRDGTFTLHLPDRVSRLRLVACDSRSVAALADRDPRIAPRTDRLNVITVPEDFHPLRRARQPLYPPKRSNHAMERTADRCTLHF